MKWQRSLGPGQYFGFADNDADTTLTRVCCPT
jgi:hypothetical protein